MTDTESINEQTIKFGSESNENFNESNNDFVLQPQQQDLEDGTESGKDSLWSNKNYQFETKEASFYQASTPNIDRKVAKKINFAIDNTDKCPKCKKSVYAQEMIKAFNNSYHKACFRCISCNNALQTNKLAEHENELYCQNCYDKKFGNKKYESHLIEIAKEDDNDEEFSEPPVNYRSVLNQRKSLAESSEPDISPRRTSMFDNSARRKSSILDDDKSKDYKSVKNLLKPVGSNGTQSLRKKSEVNLKDVPKPKAEALWSKDMLKSRKVQVKKVEKCTRCVRDVERADEVKFNNKFYHKKCIQCSICRKDVETKNLLENDKVFYCRPCYLKSRRKQSSTSQINEAEEFLVEFNSRETKRCSHDDNSVNNESDCSAYQETDNDIDDLNSGIIEPSTLLIEFENTCDFENMKANVITIDEKLAITELENNLEKAFLSPMPQIIYPPPKSPVKKIQIVSERCDVCKKTVYQVEEIKILKYTIHKSCFKCCKCHKLLERGNLAQVDSELYCLNCYKKIHASKGFDFGTGALQLEIKQITGSSMPINTETLEPKENFKNVTLKSVVGSNDLLSRSSIDDDTSSIKVPPWLNDLKVKSSTPVRSFYKSSSPAKFTSPSKVKNNILNIQPKQSRSAAATNKYNNKTDKCSKCHKSVYAVEGCKAINKLYHKTCLKCNICNKTLEPSSTSEHDDNPYCKNCYNRNFGPGSSNKITQDYRLNESSARSSRSNSTLTIQEDSNEDFGPRFNLRKTQPTAKNSYNFNGETSSFEKRNSKSKFGGSEKCTRCRLPVYEMEKVIALKTPFHKLCYSCFDCGKTLSTINCCENGDGEIFCKSCFSNGTGLDRAL